MLALTLVSGLAGFTIWHAIARKQPPGIRQAYAALPDRARAFLGCPWCAGAWFAAGCVIAAELATGANPDPIVVALEIFGAASIPGTLDSFTPDDGELN